jgi:hypothetical protein
MTRQHTSAYVSIRPLPSAYVRLRQHTSAYIHLEKRALREDNTKKGEKRDTFDTPKRRLLTLKKKKELGRREEAERELSRLSKE